MVEYTSRGGHPRGNTRATTARWRLLATLACALILPACEPSVDSDVEQRRRDEMRTALNRRNSAPVLFVEVDGVRVWTMRDRRVAGHPWVYFTTRAGDVGWREACGKGCENFVLVQAPR